MIQYVRLGRHRFDGDAFPVGRSVNLYAGPLIPLRFLPYCDAALCDAALAGIIGENRFRPRRCVFKHKAVIDECVPDRASVILCVAHIVRISPRWNVRAVKDASPGGRNREAEVIHARAERKIGVPAFGVRERFHSAVFCFARHGKGISREFKCGCRAKREWVARVFAVPQPGKFCARGVAVRFERFEMPGLYEQEPMQGVLRPGDVVL